MKPLFKWPGGKSRELANIRPLVPNFERFIEPFVGGGALYFDLEPEQAIISDTSTQLIDFYQAAGKDPEGLRRALMTYENGRETMKQLAESVVEELVQTHVHWRGDEDSASEHALALLQNHRLFLADRPLAPFNKEQLNHLITKTVSGKLSRIRRAEEKKATWTREDIDTQVRTAFQAAFYTLVRDFHTPVSKLDESAKFFYIREFCYGGMFRYSKKSGNFNIPYGGASYDSKNFAGKIERVTSEQVSGLLARTDVRNDSFDDFFSKTKLRSTDFVFLDPPYDTSFSTYDQLTFGAKQQAELASFYAALPCPAMLVIQKTPMIEELYRAASKINPAINFSEYDTKYSFNIRSRHDRRVKHLLVRNYLLS